MRAGGRQAGRSGRWGERLVAEDMQRRGWEILGCNVRFRVGEIDIVARRAGILSFTEVKLRRNADFAAAREFVTAAKQHRLRLAAECYLMDHPTDLQPRFDVAEVYAPQGMHTARPDIIYLENAF